MEIQVQPYTSAVATAAALQHLGLQQSLSFLITPGVAGAPAPPAPSVNDGATPPSPAAPPQQKKKKKGRQKKGRPPKKAPDRDPSSTPGLSTPTTASC